MPNTQAEYRFTIEWAGETPEVAETRAKRLVDFVKEHFDTLTEILGDDQVRGGFDWRVHCLDCDALAPSLEELSHNEWCGNGPSIPTQG